MLVTPAERRAILRLAHPTHGVDLGNLGPGLQRHLVSFVSTSMHGMTWLTAPHHRQLLQVSGKVLLLHPCLLLTR